MALLELVSTEKDEPELGPTEVEWAALLALEECFGEELDEAAPGSSGLEWLASRDEQGQDN